jgi:hypothetical protein
VSKKVASAKPGSLRSQDWFDSPDKIDVVAFHLDRVVAHGLTVEKLCAT